MTVRYRRPAGSVPPLTDAIGHLLDVTPLVRVRTKTGAVVQFASEDVVALRALSDAPVRTSDIRALEHAAALAWPGIEQHWLDGWLLQAGDDVNHAVPLGISATSSAIPSIVDWYRHRHLTPRLLIPDRLLRLSHTGGHPNRMLVRDVHTAEPDPLIQIAADGDLASARHPDATTVRGAVTAAPDGTRWVGLSAIRTAGPDAGHSLYTALLSWGAARGATRGYLRVTDGDRDAAALARSLGFALHHHARYVTPTP